MPTGPRHQPRREVPSELRGRREPKSRGRVPPPRGIGVRVGEGDVDAEQDGEEAQFLDAVHFLPLLPSVLSLNPLEWRVGGDFSNSLILSSLLDPVLRSFLIMCHAEREMASLNGSSLKAVTCWI